MIYYFNKLCMKPRGLPGEGFKLFLKFMVPIRWPEEAQEKGKSFDLSGAHSSAQQGDGVGTKGPRAPANGSDRPV